MSDKINIDYYQDREYVTNSMLGYLKQSPGHLLAYLNGEEKKESTAFDFGEACHCFILEPNVFSERFMVVPKIDGRTKDGKAKKLRLEGEKGDRKILQQDDYDTIRYMADSLLKIDDVAKILTGAKTEQVYKWQTGDGVKCKGKIDIVGMNIIADYKTQSDPFPESFVESALHWGYGRQAAWYLDGLEACGHKADEFIFVVQSKIKPYRVGVYRAGEQFISDGRVQYQSLLAQYKRLFIDNTDWQSRTHVNGVL